MSATQRKQTSTRPSRHVGEVQALGCRRQQVFEINNFGPVKNMAHITVKVFITNDIGIDLLRMSV